MTPQIVVLYYLVWTSKSKSHKAHNSRKLTLSNPLDQSFVEDLSSANEDPSLPKHVRLRDYVASQIESGAFKPGMALPSENWLATSLSMSRSTVRQAFSALEHEGLIRKVHGKGSFVQEDAREKLNLGQDLFALVVPETEASFYPSLQSSFAAEAAKYSSQILVCNTHDDIQRQGNTILQLIDLQVAGVAIVPPTDPETPLYHVRQLQRQGIPVVCCSRMIRGAQAPLLAMPFEEIGYAAGEKMTQAGHKKIGFLGSTQGEAVQAYEQGLRRSLSKKQRLQVYCGHSIQPFHQKTYEQEIANALSNWFQQPSPPTAIFCSFDSLAELAYLQLTQNGIRVPQDVSLVSFGGTVRGTGLASRLTAITIDEVKMGEQIIQLLQKMRQGSLPFTHCEIQPITIGFSAGETL